MESIKKYFLSYSKFLWCKAGCDGRNGLQAGDDVSAVSDAGLDAAHQAGVGLDGGVDAAPDRRGDRRQVAVWGGRRQGHGQDDQTEENGGFHFGNLKTKVEIKKIMSF